VTERYDRFLGTKFKGGPPVPLALRLGLDRKAIPGNPATRATLARRVDTTGRRNRHAARA
jgi:hypothetical protein